MAAIGLSVEGPDFVDQVRRADQIVHTLEANRWDFSSAPAAFAKPAGADVFAKEAIHIFDGRSMTRIGRLVMGGIGHLFHLMGPIPALSHFKCNADSHLLDAIHEQIGYPGLEAFPEFCEAGPTQRVEFFNNSIFYQLRDLVFWTVLHGSGTSPSPLEHMARQFASGMVVQNMMYAPSRPSPDDSTPVLMEARAISVSFPTSVVEWMDKPLFGGLYRETIHSEYLLTHRPSQVSHPYLPLVCEGRIEYNNMNFYLRHFAGIAPKDATRGPGVALEGKGK